MIIAKIVQKGQIITLEDVVTTFQYSANLKMQFVIDESYKDCIITGWYRKFWKKEEKYLLDMQEDGTFLLGQDVFENDGTVEFSFSLNYPDGKIVHLGVVEYYVKKSFGNSDAILPENEDAWITIVAQAVKLQMKNEWGKDYKPQLEENLHVIDNKVDEINLTAVEVKQNALESSTNAQSALESANNANDSANLAESAKEKALEYSSSAERFKNEASTYASQANLAKSDAQQSAKDASNSASSALQNANKAKEHLDSVNTAVSDFNTDYTEKINEFNTNYTTKKEAFDTTVNSANTALNATITEANTSIDAKVITATEQADIAADKADKAKAEADRAVSAVDSKLDKNQGAENAGKTMVIDNEGNVIPGNALPKNIYTQEEVNDLLEDKMDKPYVDITIDNNTTIDCTLEGKLKISSITGNVYQKTETDIVPTPARPVPIVSKKILANGEYVELRSLKETENLADEKMMISGYIESEKGQVVSSTTANEIVSDFISLNSAVQLSYRVEGTTVANVPKQGDEKLWLGIGFYDADKNFISRIIANSKIAVEKMTLANIMNCPANAKYFRISYRKYEDVKTVIVLGSKNINSYIPPTVRDYKFVDHVNKKAWIERNVDVNQISSLRNLRFDYASNGYKLYSCAPYPTSVQNDCELSTSLKQGSYYIADDEHFGLSANLMHIIVSTEIDTVDKLKKYLGDITFQYKLATPIIEEIAYSENDTTEAGYSFQDTTSPSPTLPSEIVSCTSLDIKTCGKNLFDAASSRAHQANCKVEVEDGVITMTPSIAGNDTYFGGVLSASEKYNDKLGTLANVSNIKKVTVTISNKIFNKNYITVFDKNLISLGFIFMSSNTATVDLSKYSSAEFMTIRIGNESMSSGSHSTVIQVEEGDTATEYQPYQESSVRLFLDKPLYGIGNVFDVIDVINSNRENHFAKTTLIGSDEEWWRNNVTNLNDVCSFYIDIGSSNLTSGTYVKIKCNNFIFDEDMSNKECIRLTTASNGKLRLIVFIKNVRLNKVSEVGFKNWLKENPIEVIYETSSVDSQSLDSELIEKLKQLRTFSPVTHVFVNNEPKATLNCQYPKNLFSAVQQLETKLSALQKEAVKNV